MRINTPAIKDYFQENMPIVMIPYKYIVLPLLIIFFLFLGASFIRPPGNLAPSPDSTISANPVFRFEINKNFMYRNYSVKVKTKKGEPKIRVRENGNNISVTPISPLLSSDKIDLEIVISKGFSFFTLWSKTFNYSYTVSR